MKLKKTTKKILLVLFIALIIIIGILVKKSFFTEKKIKEVKVISTINDYGYSLRDNKNQTYKEKFDKLKEILAKKPIDYNEYATQITDMFIYDFYSLDDKVAKNDIGGVDFVHPKALANFLENAESTYYKYIESNIYGHRNQSLPMVKEVTVGNVEQTEYKIEDTSYEEAYKVSATWSYTTDNFSDYQTSADITIVKEDNKLYIVELQK